MLVPYDGCVGRHLGQRQDESANVALALVVPTLHTRTRSFIVQSWI